MTGIFLAGCTPSIYKGDMKLVDQVDLDRYMGTWYVVGVKPTIVEKSCVGGIEHYDRKSENEIDITFTCFKDNLDGKKKVYNAKAEVINQQTNAQWAVQFFWPIKFSFLILEVDPDYQWTVIGYPSKDYAWIMSRQRQMDPKVYQARLDNLKDQGYDLDGVVKVPQPKPANVRKYALSELEWKNRLIISLGSDQQLIQKQNRLLSKDKAGKEERKLLILEREQLIAEDLNKLRADGKADNFEVLLIGLDGQVKNRFNSPQELDKFFQLIDAMPMRQKEI